MRLTIKYNPSNQLRKVIKNLSGDGRRKVLAAGARIFYLSTLKNFGPTGEDRPNQWPKLSPKYQKRIRYFGPPLLIRSGALIKSIQWKAISSNQAVIWTDIKYGAAHQFGRGRLPRRAYFPVKGKTFIMPKTKMLMERAMFRAATT